MSLPAASIVAALRRDLASIEATALSFPHAPQLRLDHEPAILRLGGGLTRGALHEVAAARESEIAAATGFAFALAAHCTQRRAILWVAGDLTRAESGALYGPGLDDPNLVPPERLVAVSTPRSR